jgi:hypothetical protein
MSWDITSKNGQSRVGQTRPLTPPRTAPLPAAELPGSAAASAPAEAVKPKRGLLGHLADVFVGGGEALFDMGKGLFTLVRHPIQTIKGIGFITAKLVTNPKEGLSMLGHAFVEPYKEAIREGRPGKALGRGIVEIGSLFVGPSEVMNAAKGIKNFFTGGAKAQAAIAKASTTVAVTGGAIVDASMFGIKGADHLENAARIAQRIGADPAKAAKYAQTLEKLSSTYAQRASQLEHAARIAASADDATKLAAAAQNASQYSTRVAQASALAAKGEIAAAQTLFKMGPEAAKIMGPVTKAAKELSTAAKVIEELSPLAQAGGQIAKLDASARGAAMADEATKATKASTLAAGGGLKASSHAASILPSADNLAQLATRVSKTSPFMMLTSGMASTMGRLGELPTESGEGLTAEKAAAIAAKYRLAPELENVRSFLSEVAGYQESAVGPDAGTPEQVRQVQAALRVAGYEVEASGSFDEATSLAVIDFKYKSGLHQDYRKEDGVWAVNEYLDPASAKALFDRIQTVANEEATKLASKFRS